MQTYSWTGGASSPPAQPAVLRVNQSAPTFQTRREALDFSHRMTLDLGRASLVHRSFAAGSDSGARGSEVGTCGPWTRADRSR